MTARRYDIVAHSGEASTEHIETDDGMWVRHSDAAQLEARCDSQALQIRNMLSDCNEHCQDRTHTQLQNNKLKHELTTARTLLARCLTELDGNEMDKVRGTLVAEVRAWIKERE